MCANLWAAPVWQKNIPDAFQHQSWGAPPGPQPQPFVPIAGAADPGGDGLEALNLAGGQMRLLSWELNGVFNPNPPLKQRAIINRPAEAGLEFWCGLGSRVNPKCLDVLLYLFQRLQIFYPCRHLFQGAIQSK
jgi:hypothetical protein